MGSMGTPATDVFSQLTWTIMLTLPAVVTALHLPLLVEWLFLRGRAPGRTPRALAR